jgi:hypothetical protein
MGENDSERLPDMSGEVPEIYWYGFWVGLAIVVEAFGFYMAFIIHRRNMSVLELLRSYAERGIEPPAAVAELLNEQIRDPGRAWKSSARGMRLQRFIGFLFTGCVIGGVAWWLIDSAGPGWAVYPTVSATLFFAVGAIGFLLTAIVTPEH